MRGARHGLSQEERPQHRRYGPQPLGLSQAAHLPGRHRGRYLLPQAGLRLCPLHLARGRPLQGLCLVLGGGLQPHCLRSPATRLKPLRRPHEAANWQSPALPHARDYAGKLFPALIARSIKQNSGNTSTIQTQTLRQTLKPKVKPLVYGQKLAYTQNTAMFYILRFLLGACEAGFFPGVLFLLTLWFPFRYRAQMVGSFMLFSAIANAIGAPVGGALLDLNGLLGLKGWQWVFIVTGIPAVLMGFVTLAYLDDRPATAHFLAED